MRYPPNSGGPTGWICGPRTYYFKGWHFEYHAYCGPWPLKKDGEPRKRAGRVFWKVCQEFADLPKAEREKYRTGGGCAAF